MIRSISEILFGARKAKEDPLLEVEEEIETEEQTAIIDPSRVRELFASGDSEIVSSRLIDFLSKEPWNSEALKMLSETKTGMHRDLILIDALKADPRDSEILEELVSSESERFLRNEDQGIESLVNRFERVISPDTLEQKESFNSLLRVIEEKYAEDPFHSRDIALSIMRAIAKFSDSKSLDFFSRLRRNMLDSRIKRVAYTSSKREGRFFLSLGQIDCFKDGDERDFERNGVQQSILEILFKGDFEQIEILLEDVSTPKSGMSRIFLCLEEISPYSEKIFDFVNEELVKIKSNSGNEEEIDLLRNKLGEEFDNDTLLINSSYEKGDFYSDLSNLPLYLIRSRVLEEVNSGIEIREIVSISNSSMAKMEPGDRRRLEVLLSVSRVLRPIDKNAALSFLNRASKKIEPDERLLRMKARLQEDNGNIDEAVLTLDGLEQPSSVGLLSRLVRTRDWIERGYDLSYLGEQSEGYEPKPFSVMYNVHSSLPYKTSGYTIRTREVVSNLRNLGLDIDVFVRWGFPLDREDIELDDFEDLEGEYIDSGIKYSISPDPGGMISHKFEDFCQRAAESILEKAKEKRPMAIFSASDASIGLASSMVARSLGLPFIYEMRGIWAMTRSANNPGFENSTRYKLMMALERQCALSAHTVIAISEEMSLLVQSWGVEKSKILVVPNGVSEGIESLQSRNDSDNAKLGTKKRPIIFGYLGSMVHYEGLENIIEAARIISKKRYVGMRFVLVGDGKSRESIEDLIVRNGVQDIVELRGKIPNQEVPQFYSEVDVIILPRLSYPVCEIVPALKPLEAMSYGKCVVSSDVGPARELITDGKDGFLFESGDAKSLVDSLLHLKKNVELIPKVGNSSLEMVRRERNWTRLLRSVSKRTCGIQLLRESESRLPNTNFMTEVVEMADEIVEGNGMETMSEFFSELLPQTRGVRMRRNCFLAFLRAIGNENPSNGVSFFFENEEFADRRSVRSAVTYSRRAGRINDLHLLIRRYGDDLDEEFVSRFDDITRQGKVTSSGIFVWPTRTDGLKQNRPKVATILDRFSFDSLKFEFELHPIPRKSYKQFFEENDFDFVFMESFWASHNDDWRFAMSSNNSPMGDELNTMIEFVKEKGIKTVFWNKEDPINYDTFIQSAKRFDYVFTSDVNIIPRYIEDCGHERVFPLEFACEPRLHNPIRNRLGLKDLSFAGAWYARGHENRKEQIRMLLDASMEYDLDIFDRFFDDDSPNKFPKKYQRFVRGSLSYDEARTTYRMYKAVLNVNTIQDSPTMFSRRVYEVLASSSYVISTPSLGVERFEHGVSVVGTSDEASKEISKILDDKMYREKESHLGHRKVMTEDTYRKRVEFICEKIGVEYNGLIPEPLVSLVCVTNRPEMIDNILSNFNRQTHTNIEMIICITANNADYKEVKGKVRDPRIRLIRVAASLKMGPCLNRGFSKANGEYIGKFDDDDYYGANYISDQLLAFSYSEADIVGKTSIFMFNGHDGRIYRRYPNSAHKFQNLVLGPTLMMKREVFDRLQFRDVGLGEDTTFLRDASAMKMSIYASDPFNFMYIRRASSDFHSWNPEQDELLRGAEFIEDTSDWEHIVNI